MMTTPTGRSRTGRRTTVAAGLVVGLTAVVVAAVPSLAQAGTPTSVAGQGTTACAASGENPARNGTGNGNGTGNRAGSGTGNPARAGNGHGSATTGRRNVPQRQGKGTGNGTGAGSGTVTSGTLTAAQKSTLAAVAQDEKLAHDLYVALATRYPDVQQFSRIAQAETRHLAAVRTLLTRYGIADPTAGTAAGTFSDARFQALYDNLLAGATTSTLALAAGVTVEQTDIADITRAMSALTAPDVLRVYASLRTGSQHHLAAFGG